MCACLHENLLPAQVALPPDLNDVKGRAGVVGGNEGRVHDLRERVSGKGGWWKRALGPREGSATCAGEQGGCARAGAFTQQIQRMRAGLEGKQTGMKESTHAPYKQTRAKEYTRTHLAGEGQQLEGNLPGAGGGIDAHHDNGAVGDVERRLKVRDERPLSLIHI